MQNHAQTILAATPDDLAAARRILWRYEHEAISLAELLPHYALVIALEVTRDDA